MYRVPPCVILTTLILLSGHAYSNLPSAYYYNRPFPNTTKFSRPFFQWGKVHQHVLGSLVKTQTPTLCDECDQSRPNPCGDVGLQCLRGTCVSNARDLKKCRGDLPPGGLCEICIDGLRDCASGLECRMNHCIKNDDTRLALCSEDSKDCQLSLLRKCAGSGPCQRCGGGMPACGHQLRCVDGRCAFSFNSREKCDERLNKKKKERQLKAKEQRNLEVGVKINGKFTGKDIK